MEPSTHPPLPNPPPSRGRRGRGRHSRGGRGGRGGHADHSGRGGRGRRGRVHPYSLRQTSSPAITRPMLERTLESVTSTQNDSNSQPLDASFRNAAPSQRASSRRRQAKSAIQGSASHVSTTIVSVANASASKPINVALPAADLTELSEKLTGLMLRGAVECVVCLDRVRRDRPIWSCDTCYTITHLHCVRKWVRQATNDSATYAACPSCRAPIKTSDIQFFCYCRRRKNPVLEPGLTPGSCGDPCLKLRGVVGSGCEHRCSRLCHPGPCAPCVLVGEPVVCFCGAQRIARNCGDPVVGVSCGGVCGRERKCGHSCDAVCHEGPCLECEKVAIVQCYCGSDSAQLPCGVKGFNCGLVCSKPLACGQHKCQRICHEGECGQCEFNPKVVMSCPCGKRNLTEAEKWSRKSCLDEIPTCGAVCERKLSCLGDHTCQQLCGHEGPCGACAHTVQLECRCGSSVIDVPCGGDKESVKKLLVCDKKCNSRLKCRQHSCQVICCPFKKRKALSRRNVLQSESLWGDDNEGAHFSNAARRRLGHVCTKTCNRQLSCGLHVCDLGCGHPGSCPPCGILIREALYCACGSTSIRPPVRCGTSPPECDKKCTKIRPCGHACPYNCHSGECPPCVELVKVNCVGGHGESRYVPCHIGMKGIRCHRACGRPLKCGIHACRSPCHGGGEQECEPSQVDGCSQICGLARKKCEHSCRNACHAGMLCPEVACKERVRVQCPCGRKEEEAMCLRGGHGNIQEPEDSIRLSCDSDCASHIRLQAFASAIGKDDISGVNSAEELVPPTKYSDFLFRFAESEPNMLAYFEREISQIVQGKVKKVVLDELPQLHRLVLHTLADLYKLDSESKGQVSARQIVIRHRGAGVKPIFPKPLLSEAFTLREQEKKRSRQLETRRVLAVHVASSMKYSASMDVESRVEHVLREHAGSYRLLGRVALMSNLIGVSVEFSTAERAALVLSSLQQQPGVSVDVVGARSGNRGSEKKVGSYTHADAIPGNAATDGWDEGNCIVSMINERGEKSTQAENTQLSYDVPESWDD